MADFSHIIKKLTDKRGGLPLKRRMPKFASDQTQFKGWEKFPPKDWKPLKKLPKMPAPLQKELPSLQSEGGLIPVHIREMRDRRSRLV